MSALLECPGRWHRGKGYPIRVVAHSYAHVRATATVTAPWTSAGARLASGSSTMSPAAAAGMASRDGRREIGLALLECVEEAVGRHDDIAAGGDVRHASLQCLRDVADGEAVSGHVARTVERASSVFTDDKDAGVAGRPLHLAAAHQCEARVVRV